MVAYDREEDTQDAPPKSSLVVDAPASLHLLHRIQRIPSHTDWALCAETNIVHFGGASATNSSTNLAMLRYLLRDGQPVGLSSI